MTKSKAKTNTGVIIYTSEGDHLSAEVEKLVSKNHAKDWKIKDIREVMDDDEIMDAIESSNIHQFPIICINGKYISFNKDIDPQRIIEQIEKTALTML